MFVSCIICFAACIASSSGASVLSGRVHTHSQDAFMLLSGMSSPNEMCFAVAKSVDSSDLTLQPCAAAVAAGDGRDVFNFNANGQIRNVATNQCVGLLNNDVTDGGRVLMMDCDRAAASGGGRSTFEISESGQLKFLRDGNFCLSQKGIGAGSVDVALHAPASATSTADAKFHGANMAVGQDASTFWASRIGGGSEGVEFLVDFGETLPLDFAEIYWEFPAKSFSFFLSNDGKNWTETFATDTNMLNVSRVQLGSRASTAKVIMREPAPLGEKIQGNGLYGISAFRIFASQLQTIAESCEEAAKSSDARDKVFLSYVSEYDPRNGSDLRSELPALAAARAALASTTSKIAATIPKLASCSSATARLWAIPDTSNLGAPWTISQDEMAIEDAKRLVENARTLIGLVREALM